MKTKITVVIAAIILAVLFGVAQSGTSSPNPPDGTGGLQAQLQAVQAELQQVTARMTAMDGKLQTLEQANADLRRRVQALTDGRPVPVRQLNAEVNQQVQPPFEREPVPLNSK